MSEKPTPKKSILVALGAAVVVIIVAIVGGAMLMKNSDTTNPNPDPANTVALPAGVTPETGYGAPLYNTATPQNGETPSELHVYFDFQCPACKQWTEQVEEPLLSPAGAAGQANITYYPMTFLDSKLGNTSSRNATAAFGCAIDQGVGNQFYSLLFGEQGEEGSGYTEQQLLDIALQFDFTEIPSVTDPQKAVEEYTQCVTDGTYSDWGAKVDEAAFARGVQGTPTLYIGEKEVPREYMFDLGNLPKEFFATETTPEPEPAS